MRTNIFEKLFFSIFFFFKLLLDWHSPEKGRGGGIRAFVSSKVGLEERKCDVATILVFDGEAGTRRRLIGKSMGLYCEPPKDTNYHGHAQQHTDFYRAINVAY